jgi:hypothetical protein
MQPIFLISLPRSGSTLVQRVLTSHDKISSVSEPWFLLPVFWSLHSNGVYASYNHKLLNAAVEDLMTKLPNGMGDYAEAVRRYAMHVYASLSSPGDIYFIDKTPRYSLIADALIRFFPDARFIFLWRNPLSVTSSLINTYGKGKWILDYYRVDLYHGLSAMLEASDKKK